METQPAQEAITADCAKVKALLVYVNALREKTSHGQVVVIAETSGRKYIRLVAWTPGAPTTRSAFGFIDTTNGAILKAVGWKSPAKNFARGKINNPEKWGNWIWSIS